MFDNTQHLFRLSRAKKRFVSDQDFLMKHVVEDMLERLSAVKRSFPNALALSGRTEFLDQQLQAVDTIGTVRRFEEAIYVDGEASVFKSFDDFGFESDQFDLAIAPLALHWANDLPGAFIQLQRALKPDGLMMAVLPGPETLHELRTCMLQAESEVSSGAALRVDAFTDVRDAGGLLQRAGFALPVVDQDVLTIRYSSFAKLIADLRSFGATFHGQGLDTNPRLNRAILARVEELYHEQFSDPDGKIRATFQFVSMSGWKPHDSQQKPLEPGSAKARLADALNVKEEKL